MQGELSAWIPTVIALSSITILLFLFRKIINEGNKMADQQIREMKQQLKEDEKKYITIENHLLICQNSFLKVKEIINNEMNKFKDDFFKQLRIFKDDITETIRENGNEHSKHD